MKEADIDAVVGRWLESRGLAPHYQVIVPDRRGIPGGRVDVVGHRHGLTVAVESKVRAGVSVLAQALRWVEKADESWIAVPSVSWDVRTVAQACGVGVILIRTPDRYDSSEWRTAVPPVTHPQRNTRHITDQLHHEQRATEPGAGAAFETGLMRTCRQLVAWVSEHPGATLSEAVSAIEHHCAHKRSAISTLHPYLHREHKMREDMRELLATVRIEGRGANAQLWPVGKEVF